MDSDDAQRRRSAGVFYSRFVDACWAHNEVHITRTGIGAALWIPLGMPLVFDEDTEALIAACLRVQVTPLHPRE